MKKKLFFLALAIIISSILICSWYRSTRYALAFFMPIDDGTQKETIFLFRGIYEAWQLGLQDAQAKSYNQIFEEIPADIKASIPILKQKIRTFIDKHPRWLWNDNRIIIVPGFTSGQLQAAKDVIQEAHRKILCVSAAATTPLAQSWPHTFQVTPNDIFATKAVAMLVRRKKYDKILILSHANEPYDTAYNTGLLKELNQQKVTHESITLNHENIETLAIDKINPYLNSAVKPALIYIGFANEIIKIEKRLDPRIELICTDTCSNLGDVFPPQRVVTVVIPAINDYTPTTKDLYKRLFELLEQKNPHFNYTLSFAVPFVYDFAYHMGNLIKQKLNFSWRYLAIKTDAARPNAALESTWYKETQHGPAQGGYWFIYTHDPKTKVMAQYNKQILGNTYTLPQSGAVAYQIGNYVWAGLSGWNMYQNIWEEYELNGKHLGTKLSYVNHLTKKGGCINWSPIHVKKYRDAQNVWWFGDNIEDTYPLVEKKYILS